MERELVNCSNCGMEIRALWTGERPKLFYCDENECKLNVNIDIGRPPTDYGATFE